MGEFSSGVSIYIIGGKYNVMRGEFVVNLFDFFFSFDGDGVGFKN